MDSYEEIVSRMKAKFTSLAGYCPDDASDIGIRIRVLAGEVYSIGAAVDWLRHQTFAQTASGEELEKRAQERGLVRKPPVAARGTLTLSRNEALWFDIAIPAGTVCATAGENPVRYVTTVDSVLKTGQTSVDVPAQAEESGAAGNTPAGTITVLVTPPVAMQAVANAAAFTGGEDTETDDALRARLLSGCAVPSNGANAAWYREAALSYDGVDSVSVVPRAGGAGTVALYLGGRGCAPSEKAVQEVSGGLNAAREICTQVSVSAAETVAFDVTAQVSAKTGFSAAAVRSACEGAVRDYFYGLGVAEPVVKAALNAALFSTGAIEDCALTVPSAAVAQNQLAVCGTVTVGVTGGT